MTLAVWPSELPSTGLRDPFDNQWGEARQISQSSAGAMNPRLRYSQVADTVTLTFDLSQDQVDILRAFWRDDLRKGVLPFAIRNQLVDGGLLLDPDGVPVLDPGGNPLLVDAWWICRIGQQPPRITIPFGVTRAVVVSLWVLP